MPLIRYLTARFTHSRVLLSCKLLSWKLFSRALLFVAALFTAPAALAADYDASSNIKATGSTNTLSSERSANSSRQFACIQVLDNAFTSLEAYGMENPCRAEERSGAKLSSVDIPYRSNAFQNNLASNN